jgi:GT2 family glycosyltransferase
MQCLLDSLLPTLRPRDVVVVVLDPATPVEEANRFRSANARSRNLRVVEATGPFSFSARVDEGVTRSRSPVVVLLNDDTAVITPDWLDRMATAAVAKGVGAVGATLLYEDGTIQHAGLTTMNILPTHAYYGWKPDDPVDGGILQADRPVWAVTGACLAVSRRNWNRVGGFSRSFDINYNDVDFCLKLSDAGLTNLVLGTVHLYHFETRSRPREVTVKEMDGLQARWYHRLGADPLALDTSALIDRR